MYAVSAWLKANLAAAYSRVTLALTSAVNAFVAAFKAAIGPK